MADQICCKAVDVLKKLSELRSRDLHVKEVRKRGIKIKLGEKEYKLSDFETLKSDTLQVFKNAKNNYLENLVYSFQLTDDENIDILDLKFIPTKRTGNSLNPRVYEVLDLNNTLKYILPDNVKVSVTIDDVRLKLYLKINQTLIFTKKSFFYTILGFTRSRSYPLDDIEGSRQMIAGSYKGDRPNSISGIDKVPFKCDCTIGSIVNGSREPILFSFSLVQPPGHEIYKQPTVKLFRKNNKSVLSHLTFYLEDDDHKSVDFNEETISFTCQLNK